MNNINWPAVTVLVLYPLTLILLTIIYVQNHSIGWFGFWFFVISYYITNISVGIGLHRLWSHNAYKANKFVEFILVMLSAGALQGPAIAWASDHFKHHTYTDKNEDPHSPSKYNNKILGFLWSHIGWMLVKEFTNKNIDRVTIVKLGRNKLLIWQLKYYWYIAVFMNLILPMTGGFIISDNINGAYKAFLFAGLGRAFQQQMTMCVNSVHHFFGSKLYYKGSAGDIWWMALFLLGENWHNFHHAFPTDYRNGVKWYHLDVHKWIIYGLSKLNLVYDLQFTAQVRIQAKMIETLNYLLDTQKNRLEILKGKIDNVPILNNLGVSIDYIALYRKSLSDIYNLTNELTEQLFELSNQIANNSSIRFVKMIKSRVGILEKSIQNLSSRIEKFYLRTL